MAANDKILGAPVGIGQPNHPDDVRQVQHLLNQHLAPTRGDRRLVEDGAFGPLTQARLTEYQRDTVRLQHPDGIADPHGPTVRSLAGVPSRGYASSADGDTAVDRLAARHPFRHEPAHTQDWINKVLPAAQAVHERWGIPVSVTIAQGAVESSWGTIHPENEYFGVKGHAPDGSSTKLATHEVTGGHRHPEKDSFRAYGSLEAAADDYGRFLNTQPRFRTALEHKDDPHRFVQEVGKAHYATDPNYAATVAGIIDQHGLMRYDVAPVQGVRALDPKLAADIDNGARSYWPDLARKGREVTEARTAAQGPHQAVSGQESANQDSVSSYWLGLAKKGREIVEARAALQGPQQTASGQLAAPAQVASTTQAATPTLRLGQ